jgi:hypothetical protein
MNEILHRRENLVTLVKSAVIANRVQEEHARSMQGILSGDNCLFQEHRVPTALYLPTKKNIEWLDTIPVARAAYIAKLTK